MTARIDDRTTPAPLAPLALDGGAARRWLRRRGWMVPPRLGSDGLHLMVREQRAAHVTFRTVAHDGLTVWRPATPASEHTCSVCVIASGSGWIRSAGRRHPLAAGTVLVLPARTEVVLETVGAGEMREVVFGAHGRTWPSTVTVVTGMAASLSSAVVDALSTSTLTPQSHEMGALHLALECVAAAATPGRPSPALHADLVARAHVLIAEHALVPGFTVDKLADLLAVSRRHLTRVMSESGRTPIATIRGMRVAAALGVLERLGPRALHDDAVARSCGFSSARTLRAAMTRAGDERFAARGATATDPHAIDPDEVVPVARTG